MNYTYYSRPDKCSPEIIGWCFSGWAFFLYADKFPNLIAWKEAWKVPGSWIRNTYYDCVVSPEDMEMIITFRKGKSNSLSRTIRRVSPVQAGPHELIRRKIGGVFYMMHGNVQCISNEDCYDLGVRV